MTLHNNDEAVSESLGYILIFGVVISCIGIMLLSGSQVISDTEKRNSLQAVEQSFNILSSDIKMTAFDSSPIRTDRIKIDGGSILVDSQEPVLTVKYPGSSVLFTDAIGSVVYASDSSDDTIAVENGALIKGYGTSNSQIVSEPRMYYCQDTRTLMISVIDISGVPSSIGGDTICNLKLKSSGVAQPIEMISASGDTVTISIKSEYGRAWEQYYTKSFKPNMAVQPGPSGWTTVTLDNVRRVIIVRYDINVEVA
mgnify:FL=1